MSFHILGIIIPTDELIFFRGVETTNQPGIAHEARDAQVLVGLSEQVLFETNSATHRDKMRSTHDGQTPFWIFWVEVLISLGTLKPYPLSQYHPIATSSLIWSHVWLTYSMVKTCQTLVNLYWRKVINP